MRFIVAAHKIVGVKFIGKPTYIHTDAMLDPSGGLTICSGTVISTRVIILTHDWSFLVKQQFLLGGVKNHAYKSVNIGENSFVGAGAIVLPGTIIGKSCIIGAGAVVKGNIEDKISKQSDLKVNNYNITTAINNNDYSNNMKHWYIGAK